MGLESLRRRHTQRRPDNAHQIGEGTVRVRKTGLVPRGVACLGLVVFAHCLQLLLELVDVVEQLCPFSELVVHRRRVLGLQCFELPTESVPLCESLLQSAREVVDRAVMVVFRVLLHHGYLSTGIREVAAQFVHDALQVLRVAPRDPNLVRLLDALVCHNPHFLLEIKHLRRELLPLLLPQHLLPQQFVVLHCQLILKTFGSFLLVAQFGAVAGVQFLDFFSVLLPLGGDVCVEHRHLPLRHNILTSVELELLLSREELDRLHLEVRVGLLKDTLRLRQTGLGLLDLALGIPLLVVHLRDAEVERGNLAFQLRALLLVLRLDVGARGPLQLLLQARDQAPGVILISLHHRFDTAGLGGVRQRVDRLNDVLRRGGHSADDERLAVPSEARRQDIS
eukprot:PhM_4_TR14132/c0_g1_i1/m.34072